MKWQPKEKHWLTKYFLKLIRKRQHAWHSKNVMSYKKLRTKVQQVSKMLKEKYITGQ